MLNLVRFCDPLRIEWTLCYLTHPWYDPGMLTALSAALPVCREGLRYERGSWRSQPEIEGLRELSARSDVVLAWGYTFNFNRLVDRRETRLVNVAHNFRTDLGRFVSDWHHLAAVSRECAASFGKYRDRVKVIENGIDLNRSFPIRGRAAMRADWGCEDGDLLIGFVGRLAEVKNCLALARAVKGLGERARLVCYGEQVPEEAYIPFQMKEIAGAERLIFREPVEDVGSVLNALDVFLLPSYSEGFSMSLLEAWAAGLPVVATRVGSLPRLEEQYGRLVTPIEPEDSAEALAAAIRKAIAGGAEMTGRAREMVLASYHVARMAEEWTDYLVAVAEGRAAPAGAAP